MPHPPKNQQKSYCNKLSKDLERVHIKNKTWKTKNGREFGHRRRVTEQTQRWQPDCRGVLEGCGSWPREGMGCWPSEEAGRQAGHRSSLRPFRKERPHPQHLESGLWPPDLEVNTFLLLSATLCGVTSYRSPGKLRLREAIFAEQWTLSQVVERGRKSKYPNEKKIGINSAGVTLI